MSATIVCSEGLRPTAADSPAAKCPGVAPHFNQLIGKRLNTCGIPDHRPANTELVQLLGAQGVDTIVLVGLQTRCRCRVIGARAHGFLADGLKFAGERIDAADGDIQPIDLREVTARNGSELRIASTLRSKFVSTAPIDEPVEIDANALGFLGHFCNSREIRAVERFWLTSVSNRCVHNLLSFDDDGIAEHFLRYPGNVSVSFAVNLRESALAKRDDAVHQSLGEKVSDTNPDQCQECDGTRCEGVDHLYFVGDDEDHAVEKCAHKDADADDRYGELRVRPDKADYRQRQRHKAEHGCNPPRAHGYGARNRGGEPSGATDARLAGYRDQRSSSQRWMKVRLGLSRVMRLRARIWAGSQSQPAPCHSQRPCRAAAICAIQGFD